MSIAYVGIDPGKKGALAIIEDGTTTVVPCDYKEYALHLCGLDPAYAVVTIENVHAMPKQGVSSTFSFGEGFGIIQGILIAHGFKYNKVDPRVWKKHYGISKDKDESIHLARETFPSVSLLPTPRCKKDSDGMAEALLIAKYGKDTYNDE